MAVTVKTSAWDVIGGMLGMFRHFRDPIQEELEEYIRERARVESYVQHMQSQIRSEQHLVSIAQNPEEKFPSDDYRAHFHFMRGMSIRGLQFSIVEHETTLKGIDENIVRLEKMLEERAEEKANKITEPAPEGG